MTGEKIRADALLLGSDSPPHARGVLNGFAAKHTTKDCLGRTGALWASPPNPHQS